MSFTRQVEDMAARARAENAWQQHLAACQQCQRHESRPERGREVNQCTQGRNLKDEVRRIGIWGTGIAE